jgi:hypothetical protein
MRPRHSIFNTYTTNATTLSTTSTTPFLQSVTVVHFTGFGIRSSDAIVKRGENTIMKRGRMEMEGRSVEQMIAGPSRRVYSPVLMGEEVYDDEECHCEDCAKEIGVEGVDTASSCSSGRTTIISTIPPLPPSTSHTRRKPPNRPGTLSTPLHILILTLIPPFLPFVHAAPPLSRPTSSTPPTSTTQPHHRNIKYITTVLTPTDIPTSTAHVDETELPYILTQSSDGSWQKAEGGWSMYGRQAKVCHRTQGIPREKDHTNLCSLEMSITQIQVNHHL